MESVCFKKKIPHYIDQKKAEVFLKIILNKENRIIIDCIKDKPMTVIQISDETKISVSTVYRKINHLNEQKLLYLSGIVNASGKKEFSYQSKIFKVVITFENGTLNVKGYASIRKGIQGYE